MRKYINIHSVYFSPLSILIDFCFDCNGIVHPLQNRSSAYKSKYFFKSSKISRGVVSIADKTATCISVFFLLSASFFYNDPSRLLLLLLFGRPLLPVPFAASCNCDLSHTTHYIEGVCCCFCFIFARTFLLSAYFCSQHASSPCFSSSSLLLCVHPLTPPLLLLLLPWAFCTKAFSSSSSLVEYAAVLAPAAAQRKREREKEEEVYTRDSELLSNRGSRAASF